MSPRNLLALLILLSIAALAVSLVVNLPGEKPEELLELVPQGVDLALEKVHYTQTEAGQRRWVLNADSAAVQREEGLLELENVEMIFWDTGRYREVKLTASQGRFDQQRKRVEIWGDVNIVTDLGEHFQADRLVYEQEKEQVSSTGRVRLSSPQLTMSGSGFELDLKTGRMQLQQDVQARLLLQDSEIR